MKSINILFLGASKRVSLIERFLTAAEKLGIKLNIFSCEIKEDFYPISQYAKILSGPSFKSDNFQEWLQKTVNEYKINIIIPNMDSATVALSEFAATQGRTNNCWCVVSDFDLCRTMEDKFLANEFFKANSIPVPTNMSGKFPKILKPRFGFGANGIRLIESEEELLDPHSAADFITQDFIHGQETTVDIYVSPTKGLLGYVLRDRIEVSDGEVMVCTTREPSEAEDKLITQVALLGNWCGCITLQYIKDSLGNLFVIEINPRFGGGATCAIEAGLDMPKYILCEFIGYDFDKPQKIKKIKMSRARKDYFYEF